MEIEVSRFYRVKAVAEMLDVSPLTIYRAIESGKLRAAKFGEGSGAIRVTGAAIAEYVAACEAAAVDTPASDGPAMGIVGEVA